MQNNNSKLNTILLVVLVILAAFCAWKLVYKDKETNDDTSIPSGQTQTNQNPNGSDYQPQPPLENKKTYNADGFSFDYNVAGTIKSGVIPGYGFYAEVTAGNKYNAFHLYSNTLPSNFRPEFYTGSVVINGKTFLYGDVQTEAGMERSYMYQKYGKTLIIQNDSLINLGSVEIQQQQAQQTPITYKTFTSPHRISFKYNSAVPVQTQYNQNNIQYNIGYGADVDTPTRIFMYADTAQVPTGMRCENRPTHTQMFGGKKYIYCDSNAEPERTYVLDMGGEGTGAVIISVPNGKTYLDLSSLLILA